MVTSKQRESEGARLVLFVQVDVGMKRDLLATTRQARAIRARGTLPPPMAAPAPEPEPVPALALVPVLALELMPPTGRVVVVQSRRTLAAYDDAAPSSRLITRA